MCVFWGPVVEEERYPVHHPGLDHHCAVHASGATLPV